MRPEPRMLDGCPISNGLFGEMYRSDPYGLSAELGNWGHRLPSPVTIRGGKLLNTLADARAHMLDLPKHLQAYAHWQYTAKLLIEAAEGRGDLAVVVGQLELALFHDGQLEIK